MHSSGVVHRDLKPSNIMLKRRSQNFDFGIALLAEANDFTEQGQSWLNNRDVPEQIRESVGTPSDVFALGWSWHSPSLVSTLTGMAPRL